jgi:hypothetical protein
MPHIAMAALRAVPQLSVTGASAPAARTRKQGIEPRW